MSGITYVMQAETPVETLRLVIAWHRNQAKLAMQKAQTIAHNTKTRTNYVAEASHHHNSAEFFEQVTLVGKVS